MTGVLYIILLITGLFDNENNTSQGVYFYNLFVTILSVYQCREIVRQRCWRLLATEYAGVDKLPNCLHSDTKDVNQRQRIHFPWQRPLKVQFHQIINTRHFDETSAKWDWIKVLFSPYDLMDMSTLIIIIISRIKSTWCFNFIPEMSRLMSTFRH